MGISELLVFGLLIGGFVVVNHLLKRAVEHARRQQEIAAGNEPAAVMVPEETAWGETWGRTSPADAQAATLAAQRARRIEDSATADAPRRLLRSSRPALFRSPQDLRSAIIAMTVLGPCRALEPPERFPGRDGQGAGPGGS